MNISNGAKIMIRYHGKQKDLMLDRDVYITDYEVYGTDRVESIPRDMWITRAIMLVYNITAPQRAWYECANDCSVDVEFDAPKSSGKHPNFHWIVNTIVACIQDTLRRCHQGFPFASRLYYDMFHMIPGAPLGDGPDLKGLREILLFRYNLDMDNRPGADPDKLVLPPDEKGKNEEDAKSTDESKEKEEAADGETPTGNGEDDKVYSFLVRHHFRGVANDITSNHYIYPGDYTGIVAVHCALDAISDLVSCVKLTPEVYDLVGSETTVTCLEDPPVFLVRVAHIIQTGIDIAKHELELGCHLDLLLLADLIKQNVDKWTKQDYILFDGLDASNTMFEEYTKAADKKVLDKTGTSVLQMKIELPSDAECFYSYSVDCDAVKPNVLVSQLDDWMAHSLEALRAKGYGSMLRMITPDVEVTNQKRQISAMISHAVATCWMALTLSSELVYNQQLRILQYYLEQAIVFHENDNTMNDIFGLYLSESAKNAMAY